MAFFAPLGLDCQPCNHNVCPSGTNACLTGLAPEAVAGALLGRLASAS